MTTSTVSTTTDTTRWYRLPVMWIAVALPLISFVGGGVMVALTYWAPDTEVYSERVTVPEPVSTPAG